MQQSVIDNPSETSTRQPPTSPPSVRRSIAAVVTAGALALGLVLGTGGGSSPNSRGRCSSPGSGYE